MEGQDEYKAGHTGSALDRAVQWALAYITTNPLNMQTKLESIEQGAQKNPSYLKDGRYILDMSTAYYAPASDGLYFSGEAVNGSYSRFSIKMPLASKTAAGVMSKEDKKKLDNLTIDLSLFEGAGKSLPTINAIFTHRGMMTHHRSVYTPDGDFQHIFCCEHDKDYSESQKGYLYIVFADNGLEYVTSYDTSDGYTVVPDYILRAFGEANATQSLDGTMSAADKIKLDALKEAVELPTTSGPSFKVSPFYTIGGELVTNVTYYEEKLTQLLTKYYMIAYHKGVYYQYEGRVTSVDFGLSYNLVNIYDEDADKVPSSILSHLPTIVSKEDRILLNDVKLRMSSIEVVPDQKLMSTYVGTIATFHVKKGDKFKVVNVSNPEQAITGKITLGSYLSLSFDGNGFTEAADKDYYGTFKVSVSANVTVAVSLV